ncbi:MAG TPA: transketolase C-terminal domain-containing protein [Armatimonadota bacterium]|nr:transketolase C-terminal domain-containing protein [Armatimonadota bacterium]
MAQAQGTRDGYGEALLALGRENPRVAVVDADLFRSTRTAGFAEAFPDRFFEIGIAEQDMVSTAVGLALGGMIPFANSFAVFLTGRTFDQTRQQVALPALNVKLAGSSAGITQGADGATHQSVLDVALMRSLPNMCVVVPSDPEEARLATRAAAERDGPVYLRLSRYETPVWREPGVPFEIGKAEVRRTGGDVTIAACGVILGRVLAAAETLAKEGISAEVINVHTVKPLDAETLLESCERTGAVVTVEEHSIIGGLGSAVAELLAERATRRVPLKRIGVADTFGESGTADELLEKHGLTAANIAATARALAGQG